MIEVLVKADSTLAGVYKDYRKLIKGLMVGVLATLVDMAFLMIFMNFLGLFWLTSQAMSYLLGMGVSFYLNKTFTFRNTSEKVHYQAASFAVIAFTQYLLTLGLMFVFIHTIFDSTDNYFVLLSKVIVAFIGFVYAFVLNKSLTFKIFK
ncbi:MAG TPA: GtrA family protein [Methanocella sp.]